MFLSICLGISNLLGAFVSAYPVTASFSRFEVFLKKIANTNKVTYSFLVQKIGSVSGGTGFQIGQSLNFWDLIFETFMMYSHTHKCKQWGTPTNNKISVDLLLLILILTVFRRTWINSRLILPNVGITYFTITHVAVVGVPWMPRVDLWPLRQESSPVIISDKNENNN